MAPGKFAVNPVEHTLSPIVTGATVIGVKYDGGVLVAADTLASYGSQARYKDFTRMRKVGNFSLLGASGEMSDFQYMGKLIDELDEEDWLEQDGCMLGPKQYASYVGRVMYNRRSKGNPLYNQFLLVGKKGDEPPLLAFVDHQGTFFEDDYIATGFGSYLAMPLLRNEWRQSITKAEAEQLIIKCLKICFYRDCRAFCKYTIGCCDGQTTTISDQLDLDHFWEHESWLEKRLTNNRGATADTW
jgi:20S proteasome subunit beta 7